MVAAGDRTDLAGREEPGDARGGQPLAYDEHVVIGGREQLRPATVAREQQRPLHRVEPGRRAEPCEQLPQVLVGTLGIADLEADGATNLHDVANDEAAGLAVTPEHAADQEVSVLVLLG